MILLHIFSLVGRKSMKNCFHWLWYYLVLTPSPKSRGSPGGPGRRTGKPRSNSTCPAAAQLPFLQKFHPQVFGCLPGILTPWNLKILRSCPPERNSSWGCTRWRWLWWVLARLEKQWFQIFSPTPRKTLEVIYRLLFLFYVNFFVFEMGIKVSCRGISTNRRSSHSWIWIARCRKWSCNIRWHSCKMFILLKRRKVKLAISFVISQLRTILPPGISVNGSSGKAEVNIDAFCQAFNIKQAHKLVQVDALEILSNTL